MELEAATACNYPGLSAWDCESTNNKARCIAHVVEKGLREAQAMEMMMEKQPNNPNEKMNWAAHMASLMAMGARQGIIGRKP